MTEEEKREQFNNMSDEERRRRLELAKMGKPIPFYTAAYRQEFQGNSSDTGIGAEEPDFDDLDDEVTSIMEAGPLIKNPSGKKEPEKVKVWGAEDEQGADPSVKAIIRGLAHYLDPKFETVNTNIGEIGARMDAIESHVVENDKNTQTLAKHVLKTRQVVRENHKKIREVERKHQSEIQDLNSKCDKISAEFSDKMELSYARMQQMEEIVRRCEEGGFGQFTDLEAPTKKDQYDFMNAFNKAKHSVGFFPVYRADIEQMKRALNCREDEAFRVCISQFLRLEMGFYESFVTELEEHYVELRYDGRDTLYVIFDHIERSGGRRIWQEAKQLTKHSLAGRQTPELRQLEVPQLRERKRVMEKVANDFRWEWRRANTAAYDAGERLRTRILEAEDGSYDYIIQVKLPGQGETYKKRDIPESVTLPKIQWKVKSYIGQTVAAMAPRRRDQIMKPSFVPQGRLINHIPFRNNPAQNFATIHVMQPTYRFVPGMLDPGSPPPTGGMSLDAASAVGSGRTPRDVLSRASQEQVDNFRSAADIALSVTNDVRERLQIETDNVQQSDAPPAGAFVADTDKGKETSPLLASNDQQTSSSSQSQQASTNSLAGFSFANPGAIPFLPPLAPINNSSEPGSGTAAQLPPPATLNTTAPLTGSEQERKEVEELFRKNAEEASKYEAEVRRLEEQMEGIEEENTVKETERYEKDVERRMIEEELRNQKLNDKEARQERQKQRLENNPAALLISDVDNIDNNGNQGNNIVVTPPPVTGAETGARSKIPARRAKVNKGERPMAQSTQVPDSQTQDSQTQEDSDTTLVPASSQQAAMREKTMSMTQPSIVDFIVARSSTLRDSVTEDTEEETYESATEDTPGQKIKNVENTPKLTSKPTLSLNDGSPSLAKKLEFSIKNYELVPITPGGAEDGTGQVTVKLPVKPSFGSIVNKPSSNSLRKLSLKTRIPTARRNTQSQASRSASKSVKRRNDSGEKKDKEKVNRIVSPENKAGQPPAVSAVPAAEQQAPGHADQQQAQAQEVELAQVPAPQPEATVAEAESEADATKVEDITAKSDDLSSLSVLPSDTSFNKRLEEAEENEEEATLDETVIRRETEEAVDQGAHNEAQVTEEGDLEGEEAGGAAGLPVTKTPAGVIIVKEYDSAEKGEPDKPKTPPRDQSGHMAGVQGVTPGIRVDSNIATDGSIMKKISKDLVNKSLESCGVMNTVEKKKSKEEID